MYAIAIHDRDSGELHLARDRFGEKPLFYTAAPGRFGYGSTLLAVSALPWVTDEFDPQALDSYLALHFVPGRSTIFSGIRQVLPGERLTVRLGDLTITHQRYYRPPLEASRRISDDELCEALEVAVTSRLIADVPVGVFLSGGIDSSVVAAIAAHANPAIATFSMGFSEAQVDESTHAAAVARHIGSTHHRFIFDQNHFMTLLPEVAAALDTPIGDQAVLPVYWLAREARKHVTVVLAGEGADEIFAGYNYYRQFATTAGWRDRLDKLAGLLRRRHVPLDHLDRFLLNDPPTTPSGFPLLTGCAERHRLIHEMVDNVNPWENDLLDWIGRSHGPLQRATVTDIGTWLPDDLLVKFDRMTMAHSLEGRAPFLDPRVVSLGLALLPSERMSGDSKVALRRAASRWLPDDILQRPKQGFVLPMRRWIGEWFGAWGGVSAYFAQRPVPGIDHETLTDIVGSDLLAGIHRERLLFAVVMLAEWWHCFAAKRASLRQCV
ncbi:asparagine synthase (glutamine-hydrolyzing) [Acidihalobacter yilgarnensis]|uniref:asparagine synthase (glutamine-hydrolyzing) n=2 Tax=Acidihalobacter yilgarnensis TaxID=2819280 RepID=A0A1D8IQ74_9GAMM|nr:asparagine synthase (glutamine-hydrolyzing) [Acidihalobacter yilgarnensis]